MDRYRDSFGVNLLEGALEIVGEFPVEEFSIIALIVLLFVGIVWGLFRMFSAGAQL
ncbi:MAG TPA: hypothetical protein VKW06_01515 [Candidatus Angelobacter sp.]|nr:hypothetical protein [Candidatus Angelobacter sp.]